MKKLLLAVTVLGISSQAMSANWELIADSSGIKFYLDTDSIQKTNVTILEDNSPLYSVWAKMEYSSDNHTDEKEQRITRMISHRYYSCQHKGRYLVSLTRYADGQVFPIWEDDSKTTIPVSDLIAMTSGSVAEDGLKLVCEQVGY